MAGPLQKQPIPAKSPQPQKQSNQAAGTQQRIPQREPLLFENGSPARRPAQRRLKVSGWAVRPASGGRFPPHGHPYMDKYGFPHQIPRQIFAGNHLTMSAAAARGITEEFALNERAEKNFPPQHCHGDRHFTRISAAPCRQHCSRIFLKINQRKGHLHLRFSFAALRILGLALRA